MNKTVKKVSSYALTFIAGTLFSGGAVFAATTYVQAQKNSSVIAFNGKQVSAPPSLVYDGSTYVQLYSIQQGFKQFYGVKPSWDGHTFNVVTNQPSSGSTSGSAVALSSLPYTFKASDGMTITVTSINATSTSTVFNVTFSNTGLKQDGDLELSMFGSSLSDGGSTVKLESDADSDLTSPYNATYNDLHPGQSVQDTLTFDPLQAGTTQFTWYFEDFDLNTQHITFDLSK